MQLTPTRTTREQQPSGVGMAENGAVQDELTLRQIVDGISALVAVLTPDGAVEIVNRQVLDYFGKTLEEMREWSSSDAVHPDDLPGVIAVWTRSIESGQPYDVELRQRGADGVYRWFHAQGLPVRDAEGCILRWFVLQTDVDERKKAEEKVRRSEEYLTEAQHLSRTGSFGCNVSSGEMFWSDETFRIFGYDRATKPAVEAILERAHPEDKARVQEQILRATREGKDCDLEYRLLLPDDSVKHVHVVAHASKDEPGGFEFVGAVMDVTAAKEAGERIRKDERELATTIETIPALVLSFLPDGTVDFVSHRWLDYVGLSREEMFPTRKPLSPTLGGAWKSTNHPDDLDRALNKWQAALATGEPLELETRYRRADGQYRWFLVRSVPLRDEIGKIVKWYATFTDIDDRKQAEEKLRRSERELRLIFESIPAMVYTISADGDVELVNQRLLTFLGTTAEALKEWIAFIHPDDQARVLALWKSTIEAGDSFDVEHRLRRGDGVYRWFNSRGTPVRDAEGHVVRWYSLLTDVDERKRAEDALRQSERELHQLVDSVPAMIAVANSEGTSEYLNKRAIDYLDTTPEEFSDRPMATVYPEDQELLRNEWLQCNALGQPLDLVHRVRRFDGVYRWVHVRGEPLRDDRGQIVRWYYVFTDIDDQRRAEEALRESEQHLRLLVETIPALVWRTTAEGTPDYVNRRIVDYIGQELEQIGWHVFHPDDRNSSLAEIASCPGIRRTVGRHVSTPARRRRVSLVPREIRAVTRSKRSCGVLVFCER